MNADKLREICREAFAAGESYGLDAGSCFESWWSTTPYGKPIRYGSRVRLKKPKRGQTKLVGRVTSHPRVGSRTCYVVWPNAWSGWIAIDEIEHAL